MTRAVAFFAFFASFSALAAGPFQEVQALTRTVPPSGVAPTDATAFSVPPMNLSDTLRYRVTVCASGTATLSGAGKVRLWLWHPALKEWGYNPANDLTVTGTGRCTSFGVSTDVRYGFLLPAAQGITVSAGTTVVVRVDTEPGK